MAIGVARIAREVLLVVAKSTDRLLFLVDVVVLAADLAVLVGGAWHGRGSSCRHSRSRDELLRKDEGVRTAGAKRLNMLATLSEDLCSVTVLIGRLPRANALLLVLHAFLNCSRFPLGIFDDGLVDRCHLLLRRKTSA